MSYTVSIRYGAGDRGHSHEAATRGEAIRIARAHIGGLIVADGHAQVAISDDDGVVLRYYYRAGERRLRRESTAGARYIT